MMFRICRFASLAIASALLIQPAWSWVYETDTDKMSGKQRHYGTLTSTNSLSLDFPYKGKNHGQLIAVKRGNESPDVMLTIEKGQILCRRDNCPIRVRFDDKPPTMFTGVESADHSTTTVFFGNSARFLSEAAKAKKILVQVNLYHEGAPILEFASPMPFAWPQLKKP